MTNAEGVGSVVLALAALLGVAGGAVSVFWTRAEGREHSRRLTDLEGWRTRELERRANGDE